MGSELLAAIEAEIEAIEAELAADVRFARLRALRDLRKLYRSSDQNAGPVGPPSSSIDAWGAGANGPSAPRTVNRKIAPHRSQAVDAIVMHLKNRSGPVPTKDLLEHIVSLGIDVGGSNPLNNLSAILSNSNLFASNGRVGWTLKPRRSDAELKVEAMHQAAIDTISMLDDEEVADNFHYLETNGTVTAAISSKLKVAYKEIMEEDYINDGSNAFKNIVNEHLTTEYRNRFVYTGER